MKKRLFILLLTALLLSTSCGQAAVETGTDTSTAESTTAPDTAPEETALKDDLPDTDLDGYNYRMMLHGNDTHIENTFAAELTGNTISDAVFNKLTTVKDRFNCDITFTQAAPDGLDPTQQSIFAGDDAFDMVQGHDLSMMGGVLSNLFVNTYDVPYFDFTKPWWPSETVDSMTVAGQMYLMNNNISYRNLADIRMLYFNKALLTNNGIDYPYEMVYNGTWTLDALQAIVEKGYVDTNGNGERDLSDQYGFVHANSFYCWMEPFTVEPYKKDENGNLYYEFDLERISALVEKSYNLIFGSGGYFNKTESYADTRLKTFAVGTTMFYYDKLEAAVLVYSDSEIQYGLLPMPKLDESQDDYYAGSTDRPIAIPVTAGSHLETTGLITEALNIEGYKQVFPAYYETALKSRYADQADDAAMIDIAHNNMIISFTYAFGDYKSAYNILLEDLFKNGTPGTDVASWAAKKESEQVARVAELQKFFEKNK